MSACVRVFVNNSRPVAMREFLGRGNGTRVQFSLFVNLFYVLWEAKRDHGLRAETRPALIFLV